MNNRLKKAIKLLAQSDENYYMEEGCAYLAIALNELSGYPIKILEDEANTWMDEGEFPVIAHVFVEKSPGIGIDIKGERSVEEIKADFYDLEEPNIEEVSKDELIYTYMGNGKPLYSYSREEVEEAKKLFESKNVPIGSKTAHLAHAIKLLAAYYKWEGQSIQEIINHWVNDGDKLYDPSRFGNENYHGIYDIYELLPYREYVWTKEDARRSPEEWEELKDSMRGGWDLTRPILIQVGKNGEALVGEGNHRLAVALELIEEEGIKELRNVPVYIGFKQDVFYTMGPGWKYPEERAISQEKRRQEREEYEHKRQEEEAKFDRLRREKDESMTPEERAAEEERIEDVMKELKKLGI